MDEPSRIEINIAQGDSPDGASEVYNLGLQLLQLNGISRTEIEDVIRIRSEKLYKGNIDNLLAELKQPEKLKKILRRMLDRDVRTRVKLDSLVWEGESRETEEKEEIKEKEEKEIKETPEPKENKEAGEYHENQENKKTKPCLLKVARFEKIHPIETWGYSFNPYEDGISISASKNIQIEGIGLYIPTSTEKFIRGTVGIRRATSGIFKGSNKEGTTLVLKQVTMTSKSPEVVDNIYRVMFEAPTLIEAKTKYTIWLNLGSPGSFCTAYKGTGGKSIVTGDKGVVFTFKDVFGEGRTSDFQGQIPEVYYKCKN